MGDIWLVRKQVLEKQYSIVKGVKMDYFVSAIITTYKRDIGLLTEAVDSVKGQTYQNIELIVVDDNGEGSDFQKKNAEYFANKTDVIYIVNKKNFGAQYSRNAGILASKGEMIAFLDDDDIWVDKKIEVQLRYMEEYDVGMVFCDGYIFKDRNMSPIRKYQGYHFFDKTIGLPEMLYRDYVGTTTQALIRRECFAKVGIFDPEMPARQDYEMWIRISRDYTIVGTSDILFYHRVHSGEQISKNTTNALIGYKNIYHKYKKEYKLHPEANAKMQLKLCKFNYKTKHYLKSLSCCVGAFLTEPKTVLNNVFCRITGIRSER